MKLSPFVLAIRAVSAELARRVYVPVTLVIGGILLIFIITLVWLVTVSGWWWLLLAPVIIIAIVGGVVALITWLIIKLVQPSQTKAQHRLVQSFVDDVQKTSEVVQTPKIVILFRLVKDVALPSSESFIGEVTTTATSLKSGLQKIVDSFRK